jgi:hypothetical protein
VILPGYQRPGMSGPRMITNDHYSISCFHFFSFFTSSRAEQNPQLQPLVEFLREVHEGK